MKNVSLNNHRNGEKQTSQNAVKGMRLMGAFALPLQIAKSEIEMRNSCRGGFLGKEMVA